jgi:hypothetical protein
MKSRWVLVTALAVGAWGCGEDTTADDSDAGPEPFVPHAYCPGPDCPDEPGVGELEVGAAAVEVTAVTWDATEEVWRVAHTGDRLEVRDPETGDFVDHNDNGAFDGQWLAGFGTNRPAIGAHDPQWARAIALRHENTTVVLVAIDCVGYFKGEMDRVRAAVADLEVNHVLVAATHSHQARDTLGIWGVDDFTSGLDPAYMDYLRDRTEDAIREAVAALETAHVQYASFRTRDLTVPPDGSPDGVARFHGDNRDPNIVDDEVRVLRFAAAGDDTRTIATLVNWAAHPEYAGSNNQELSSDFAHYLREGIEQGLTLPGEEAIDGIGGMAVFYPGALGGQIGPNHVDIRDWEGNPLVVWQDDFPVARAVGEQLAYFVLDALGEGGGSVTDMTAEIGFKTREISVPVQNVAYHVAFSFGIFDRELHGYDPAFPISASNVPHVLSEITSVDIGRAQLMTTPGELHPELFVGGYDGSYTPEGQEIIRTDTNPPNLADAPGPPYLRDRAREDAEYVLVLGLGNDMLGYLVPEYNYVLHDEVPYLERAPGHHYEETNSPGPLAWPTIEHALVQLLEWSPD